MGLSVTTLAGFKVARRSSGFGSCLRSLTGNCVAIPLDLFPRRPATLALEFEKIRCRLPHVVRGPGVAKDVRAESADAATGADALEDFGEAMLREERCLIGRDHRIVVVKARPVAKIAVEFSGDRVMEIDCP